MKPILLLYAMATVADYATTVWCLSFDTLAYEGNPLMRVIINNLGLEWVLVGKILLLIVLWWFMVEIRKDFPKLAFNITYFGIAVPQWIVVMNNAWVINRILEHASN